MITQNKINSVPALIANTHRANICGVPIRKYAIYGKIYNNKLLFASINAKTKTFLKKSFADEQLRCVYWCVENKAGLYNSVEKSIQIKITFKDCNRFYIVWIYQDSPMLKYIREAVKPLITDENYNKQCCKIYSTADVYVYRKKESIKREKAKREYYSDLGYKFSKPISTVTTEHKTSSKRMIRTIY